MRKKNTPEMLPLIEAVLNLRIGMKQYVQGKIRENNIDLTYEMLQVLGALWAHGKTNQQDIADRIQKNKASLTNLLDNLAKRKLITRQEDADDRRNKIISLTKEGVEYETQLAPLLNGFYKAMQKGITREEQVIVMDILNKMSANLL